MVFDREPIGTGSDDQQIADLLGPDDNEDALRDEVARFLDLNRGTLRYLAERLARRGVLSGDAGYEQYLYFRGHGIGCATHDLPSFAPGNPKRLEENMVFCFEPMLVKYEFGTACWEDIWWVTSKAVERLNACPFRWW